MATGSQLFFLGAALVGGLALFLYGMGLMTEGLKAAGGAGLRQALARATGRRMSGLALGVGAGVLAHSSAATVMLVGFVNAGLLTLEQSLAPVVGANVGTTLSMQLISFRLDAYALFAVGLGFLVMTLLPWPRVRMTGRALLGFGLLFLGMKIMKESIEPYRESLAPLLTRMDGHSLRGLLLGTGLAALFTMVVQSSGATIGLCFALASGGVLTELAQAYPIILGAHVGTCISALLGSIGTHIEARRCAAAHLVFNLFNVGIAIAARSWILLWLPRSSEDLVHQIANTHTAVMALGAVLILPLLARPFAAFLRFVVPSRQAPPEPSFLEDDLLQKPEQAAAAVLKELQRATRICDASLRDLSKIILLEGRRKDLRRVASREQILDDLKEAITLYLTRLTERHLSSRQRVLIQYLDGCILDLERISDHIDALSRLSEERKKHPRALFDEQDLDALFKVYQAARRVLHQVVRSLDADRDRFQDLAGEIFSATEVYEAASRQAAEAYIAKATLKQTGSLAGLYYSRYLEGFDRIVRHAGHIARRETRSQFRIKRKKLGRISRPADPRPIPPRVDPRRYDSNEDEMT